MTTSKPFAERRVGNAVEQLTRSEVDKLFEQQTEAIRRLGDVVSDAEQASVMVIDAAEEGRAAPWDYAPYRSASNNAAWHRSQAARMLDTLYFTNESSADRYHRIVEDLVDITDSLERAIDDAERALKRLAKAK